MSTGADSLKTLAVMLLSLDQTAAFGLLSQSSHPQLGSQLPGFTTAATLARHRGAPSIQMSMQSQHEPGEGGAHVNSLKHRQVAQHLRAHSRRQLLIGLSSAAIAMPTLATAVLSKPNPVAASSASVASAVTAGASGTSAAAEASATTEFVSGLIAGAIQKTVKELVLHPFDTVKSRIQVSGGRRSVFDATIYDDVYSGIGPAVLSGAPAASVFFAVKDAVKQQATEQLGNIFGTLTAVGAANVPYWLVRNPTEVIKTRRQTGQISDANEATAELWREQGVGGFYRGYASNIAYAFPVDATKFVIFDAFKKEIKRQSGRKKLSPLESAVFGGIASAVAQSISTPLDVARTKIMNAPANEEADDVLKVLADVAAAEGVGGLYAGVAPKLVRAVVSGALQFSVLEEVKSSVNEALLGTLSQKGNR